MASLSRRSACPSPCHLGLRHSLPHSLPSVSPPSAERLGVHFPAGALGLCSWPGPCGGGPLWPLRSASVYPSLGAGRAHAPTFLTLEPRWRPAGTRAPSSSSVFPALVPCGSWCLCHPDPVRPEPWSCPSPHPPRPFSLRMSGWGGRPSRRNPESCLTCRCVPDRLSQTHSPPPPTTCRA